MKTNKFLSMSLILFVGAMLFMALSSCTATTKPTVTANALPLSTVSGAQADGVMGR